MKLAVVTAGTRGDVQPYLALALGLERAGHDVRFITSATFCDFARSLGLETFPLRTDPQKALNEYIERFGANPLRIMNFLKRHLADTAANTYADVVEACRDVDAIVVSNLGVWAHDVGEARGIPTLATSLQPASPTRYYRSTLFPRWPSWLPFERTYNWYSSKWGPWLFFRLTREISTKYREEILGLPPRPWSEYASIHEARIPIVYGFSRHLIPKPPDWGDWLPVTGYWFLDQAIGWEPPADLVDFLASGPPPVYFGLGSVIDRDTRSVTDTVVEALDRTGRRGILAAGWTNLGDSRLPGSVLRVGDVPHDWLFPRMAAVVHHGGAGTTHTSLRAGAPTIVVPFFGDQFFWGDRVFTLGAGPRPVPRRKLSVSRLVAAIERATNDRSIRVTAVNLGRKIRTEAGVPNAVETIERLLSAAIRRAGGPKLPKPSSKPHHSIKASEAPSPSLNGNRGDDRRDEFKDGGYAS